MEVPTQSTPQSRTRPTRQPERAADALSEILRTLRFSCSAELRQVRPGVPVNLQAETGTFYAVTRGECVITLGADNRHRVAAGEVLLICDRTGTAATHVVESLSVLTTEPGLHPGIDGAEIAVGTFELQTGPANTLALLLPRAVKLSARQAVAWLHDSLRLAAPGETLGSEAVAGRMVEAFVLDILRRFAGHSSPSHGWLRALRDPHIGQALAVIHRNPGERWTVATLASRVGMSRSNFFARFTELIGEPPVQYLTRWRMLTAATMLEQSTVSKRGLASRVGYTSEEAFNRAFKRHIGMSPSEYRRMKLRQ